MKDYRGIELARELSAMLGYKSLNAVRANYPGAEDIDIAIALTHRLKELFSKNGTDLAHAKEKAGHAPDLTDCI